ncbi:MAG: response regulator transcription factor [Myxococcales bacterium]|nr:response regulator transcription factor [Myxococcales bacterium]
MSAPRRIFIIDDHPVVRRGLRSLFEGDGQWVCCGEAETQTEALDRLPEAGAELVLLDLSLREGSGLDLLKTLRARFPDVAVLMVSMHDEALYADRCLRAGARGYIMKHEPADRVLEAVATVLDGRIWLSEPMVQRMLTQVGGRATPLTTDPVARLTDRELEVFEMIGQGVGTRDIARRLGVSVKTVETYRAKIKTKLSLDTGAELVQQAVAWVQAL